ncbi:Bug family tripartite tricarboxylate transporter substrate binding protein [Lacisediminimonas profundi]|uniref:Bug family tripartite tricarboxylate transporter substrate binding protein n=1 Tax=Lacisediminimonas profundi TaxID=2603856 RepID=UPI001F503688|nr:Bug family tripartite tricarboxylate transporter substrate binding protein [Lacisediminimonas profundi]
MTRRQLLACMGAIGAGILPTAARADALDMATIVVGLSPGGATDIAARRLAEAMRGRYAKTLIVENKTGAAARLAPQHVKGSAPNGATLLLTPASMMAIYPNTYRNLGYDPIKDFAPVGIISTSDLGFAVGPAVPSSVKTITDYLAWLKANPSKANFGSGASGSGPHFLGELLARMGGVKMVHAGYRGTQPAILDLIGGHLPAVSGPLGEFLPHLKGGQIRVLAVTGSKRSAFLPNVPTFKEHGFALSEMTEWFGIFAPAGTSPQLIAQASAAMKAAAANPDLVNAYGTMGMETAWSSPEELAARLRTDMQRWRGIVDQIGFSADS